MSSNQESADWESLVLLHLLLRFYWCIRKNQLSYSMNSFLLPLSTFTLVLKERSVLLLLQPKSYYLSWYCSFFSFTGIIISILMVIHSYANSIECTQWAEKLGKKCNFILKHLHIWFVINFFIFLALVNDLFISSLWGKTNWVFSTF